MSFILNLLRPVLKWYVQNQSKKRLPNYNQTITSEHLSEPVKVVRDKWGVPHIYASNRHDLFFAQGFVQAQDRMWQMDLYRRVSSGRLSEVLGEMTLSADRTTRTLGLRRAGERDAEMLRKDYPQLYKWFGAYVAGVNAWLDSTDKLPVEFKLLKYEPAKWEIEDSLTIARLIAFQLSFGWQSEIERLKMVDAVGLEKALELWIEYPQENPAALTNGIETHKLLDDGRLEAFDGPWLGTKGASNNWVVAASKMDTGAAMLCNDPHLLLSMPSIWYENHLVSPQYETTGVSIIGVPMILIGHNRNIAWGATMTFTDSQDTFIEKFAGNNTNQYHYGDRILKAKKITEKILVKGKAPHIEEVIETHHGPIISDILGYPNKKLSLCAQALKENKMIVGFYKLNTAQNWDEFVDACGAIEAPGINMVYADTKDNTGYYVTGKVPFRKIEENFLPRQGWNPDHDWKGFIPHNEMPHVFNPKLGYVYTCNNKIVNDDYPHFLGASWMNGFRANRLKTLFESKDKYSMEDFKAWQVDFYSIPGVQYRDLYQKRVGDKKDSLSASAQKTLQLFLDWDGNLDKDSVGGSIYQVVKQMLIDLIIKTPNQADIADRFRGASSEPVILKVQEFLGHDTTAIYRILNNPKSLWLEGTSGEEQMLKALEQATKYLQETLGANTSQWRWGRLHTIYFQHAMGAQKPLDSIFNAGGHELGGDTDTVCQAAFSPSEHYGGTIMGASYRQIIDVSNFANCYNVLPTGQSGNLKSPHYTDQSDMWLSGELKPMLWRKEDVEKYKKYETYFNPKS